MPHTTGPFSLAALAAWSDHDSDDHGIDSPVEPRLSPITSGTGLRDPRSRYPAADATRAEPFRRFGTRTMCTSSGSILPCVLVQAAGAPLPVRSESFGPSVARPRIAKPILERATGIFRLHAPSPTAHAHSARDRLDLSVSDFLRLRRSS